MLGRPDNWERRQAIGRGSRNKLAWRRMREVCARADWQNGDAGEARGKSLRRRLQDMPTLRHAECAYVMIVKGSVPSPPIAVSASALSPFASAINRQSKRALFVRPSPLFPRELLHFCTAQYATVPHSPPRKHERTFCCMRVASIQPPSCWLCYSPSPSRPFAAPNHESTAPLPFTGRRRSDLQSLPSTHLFRRMRTTPAMRPAKARTPPVTGNR